MPFEKHDMRYMKTKVFDWKWWHQYPLDNSNIGRILVPIWEKMYKRQRRAPILEGWCGEGKIWDELEKDENNLCYGFPREKSRPTEDDTFFSVDTRRLGLGVIPLGFESEFASSWQVFCSMKPGDTCADYSRRMDRASYYGAKCILLRYLTALVSELYGYKASIEEKKLRELRLRREREILKHHLTLRFRVLTRDHYRCRYCGRSASEVVLQVDHIVPKSKGGPDSISNYITSCRDCNIGKRDALLLKHINKKKGLRLSLDEGQIPSHIAIS